MQIRAKPKPIYANPPKLITFASGNPYTSRKSKSTRRKSLYSCSCFFCRYVNFVDSICSRFTRTRYIVATRQFDMRQIPRLQSKHIECVSTYRSPQANIENPARDLSRCVFSVKDNTLIGLRFDFKMCNNAHRAVLLVL